MDQWMQLFLKWRSDPHRLFGTLAFFVAAAGVLLVLASVFPLTMVNLIFFSVLLFLIALYRPNGCFLLLLATIPFETINILPESFGFSLRPYQWIFLILMLTLGVRVLSGKTRWPLFRFHPLDGWLALIPLGAWVSGVLSGGEGIRLAAIVSSFYALYLLARIFFTTLQDIRIAAGTLFAAGLAAMLFGLVQNIAFEKGLHLQTIMPGRPNGTFAEPDWLGFFTVTLLVLASAALYRAIKDGEQGGTLRLPRIFSLASLLIPISMVLILTVSRSAWLAALVALSVWTVTVLVIQGRTVLRPLLQTTELAVIAFGLALFIVVDIPLTRFDLLNRAESTATGFQEITVACETFVALPTQIGGVEELSTYGCWHINLEERATLEAAGRSIQLTHRPDPNIVIRSEIYRKTWTEIRTHLVFGIGWGNIGDVLGRDEHGAAYNASNVWLEVALGAGLLGLVGLAGALGSILWRGVQLIPRLSTDDQVAAASVPIAFSILAAFLVFNLFNAGLLIGFVWVFLAMIPTLLPSTGKKI